MAIIKKKCLVCMGEGWISDHSPAHYVNQNDDDCSKFGCPIQVQCSNCQGTGETTQEMVDEIK